MPSPTDACHGLLRVRALARLTTGHPPAAGLLEVRGSLAHAASPSPGSVAAPSLVCPGRKAGSAWLATAWLLDGDWATERLADSRGGRSEGQG